MFFDTAKIPGAVDNFTGGQGDGWEEYYFLVSPFVFSFLREGGGGGGGGGEFKLISAYYSAFEQRLPVIIAIITVYI